MNQSERNLLATLSLTFSKSWIQRASKHTLKQVKVQLVEIINLINQTLEETK